VVREVADAARKYGVEPGVYLLRKPGAAEPKSVNAEFVCHAFPLASAGL